MHAEFATFAEGEAESIFGKSDRPRILSTRSDTDACLTIHEVLRVTIQRELSLVRLPGPPLQLIRASAQWALWFGLLDIDGACEVRITHSAENPNDEVMAAIELALGLDGGDPRRFLLHAIAGGSRLVPDLTEIEDEPGGISSFCMDLKALGHRLAEHAGRPLLVLWPDHDTRRRRS